MLGQVTSGDLSTSSNKCAVTENGLNEIIPTLYLLPDDEKIQGALIPWERQIILYGPPDTGGDWLVEAPVSFVEAKESRFANLILG